ncbi:hypothetical protein [Dictyobacter alpinus]|nr:hypothetical protein [Dictyobacter alpinus]
MSAPEHIGSLLHQRQPQDRVGSDLRHAPVDNEIDGRPNLAKPDNCIAH